MRRLLTAALTLAALLAAPPSHAQERGTTTGPEGSEIGKGGYVPARGGGPGSFSLQLDGGGAFPREGSFSPPLFVGATASYWGDDFYRIDLSGNYIPANDEVNVWEVLVGPSGRIFLDPFALSLGLQVGAFVPSEGDAHFVLSPKVGLDFLVYERLQLGLYANYDLTVDDTDLSIVRTYVSLGYRF